MRKHAIVLGIYFVLAIICTLPTSLSPASALLGDGSDNYQHGWFLWYFAKAVTGGHNPFHTDLIFYPFGANLAWSTFDPLAGLLALPLSVTAGPAVAYNMSIVLQLALAAFFARLLCLRVSRNAVAATIGGVLFGFSPVLLAQALGHLSLVTAFPIPLYVIALDRVLEKQEPSWKDGAVLGLCLALTAFAHYNYTVFCLMLTGVILLVDLALGDAGLLRGKWKAFAWAAGAFAAGFAPLLRMLVGNSEPLPASRAAEHVSIMSADLLGFFVPGWAHWLLGTAIQKMNRAFFAAGYEGTVFAGYAALALACIGLFSARGRQRRWAIRTGFAAALFFVLSLGPVVRLYGKPLAPGPAILFYKLPLMRFASAPARFHIMTALCLSLLACLGLEFLMGKLSQPRQRALLVGIIACAIAFENLTIPFPHSPVLDSGVSVNQQTSVAGLSCPLPASIQGGTVLTFPLFEWPYSNRAMWGQAISDARYRLVDGYVSYAPDSLWHSLFGLPVVHSLLVLQGSTPGPVNVSAGRESAAEAVRRLNLRAIVVLPSPQSDSALNYIRGAFQQDPRKAGECALFEIAPSEAGQIETLR